MSLSFDKVLLSLFLLFLFPFLRANAPTLVLHPFPFKKVSLDLALDSQSVSKCQVVSVREIGEIVYGLNVLSFQLSD